MPNLVAPHHEAYRVKGELRRCSMDAVGRVSSVSIQLPSYGAQKLEIWIRSVKTTTHFPFATDTHTHTHTHTHIHTPSSPPYVLIWG
jgi:hypothetical protein